MKNAINDPLSLSAEDLINLKYETVRIHIGDSYSEGTNQILEGHIIEVGVSPCTFLPVNIKFDNILGVRKSFNIFQIKKIEVL